MWEDGYWRACAERCVGRPVASGDRQPWFTSADQRNIPLRKDRLYSATQTHTMSSTLVAGATL